MARQKDVLTTGEVAKLCNVAPRTVSKWFDSGKLRGYRIPGSKDRRIPLDQLVRFMKAHSIPLNGLDSGSLRVMIVESDAALADLLASGLARDGKYEVRVARSAFEAGAVGEAFRPHVMLIDVGMPGLSGREASRAVRAIPDLATTRLIALADSPGPGESEAVRNHGFEGALAKPFEMGQVIRAIEESAGRI